MPLLLIGDESEKMLRQYLYNGDLFALYDNGLRAAAVVVRVNNDECELKNISVIPKFHRQGYGQQLMKRLIAKYKNQYKTMILGTGDSITTIPFYHKLGFKYFRTEKDFFTKNCPHPIIENGKPLKDMLYLRRDL